MSLRRPVFTSLLILVLALALMAQEQTGNVMGKVVLGDGTGIPGVKIAAKGSALVGKLETVSRKNGDFKLFNLPSGIYDITFSCEGFKTVKREKINVELGRMYRLRVAMEPGLIREEIVISGDSPALDVRSTATSVVIPKKNFEKLPRDRDFTSIVGLAPGVNQEHAFDGGLSIDGASSAENVFYIDGVDTTTLFEGISGQNVNFDFIEEIQVKTTGISAEYSGSMGGVINVITRSGGNEFHGSASLYFDGSSLGADPIPTLRIDPYDDSKAEYVTFPEDNWNRFEVGLGVGGYIIKDKLWFFASLMPKFTTSKRDALFLLDETYNARFSRSDSDVAGSLKLTGRLANRLTISLSGTLDNQKWEGELPPLDGSGDPTVKWARNGFEYPGLTLSGSLYYTLGNNLRLNVTGGYWKVNTHQLMGPKGPRYVHIRSNIDVPGATTIVPRYFSNYSANDGYQVSQNFNYRLTGSADLTYYFNLGGEHELKLGFQYVKIGVDIDEGYPFNYNRFYWGDDFFHFQGYLVDTTLGYVEVRWPYGTVADVGSTRNAFYIQDNWAIGKRLTLNAGVRFETEDIPSFSDLPEYSDSPVHFELGDKIAPRLGFVYDVFGNSDLKIFGSYGIYYDAMKLQMAIVNYGGFKWVSTFYDLTNPDWENFFHLDSHPMDYYHGGEYLYHWNWRIPNFETTQPDLKPFSKYEYTFGIQKRLSADIVLGARFLHSALLNAIEDIGIRGLYGTMYYNGNPGSEWIQQKFAEAKAAGLLPPDAQSTKAERNYTSVQVYLDKKFNHNWLAGISLTWSRLKGNYAGLASSDDPGLITPNMGGYFDAWFLNYDQYGQVSSGLLPTDRPLQFKLYGAYSFDWGLTVGVSGYGMSGTPVSTTVNVNYSDWYPRGRGDLGRTPFLWGADLYAEYNLKLSDKYTLQFNINVSNITNNKIARRIYSLYNMQPLIVNEQQILDGFDAVAEVDALGLRLDPRFLQEIGYTGSLAARLGAKLYF